MHEVIHLSVCALVFSNDDHQLVSAKNATLVLISKQPIHVSIAGVVYQFLRFFGVLATNTEIRKVALSFCAMYSVGIQPCLEGLVLSFAVM